MMRVPVMSKQYYYVMVHDAPLTQRGRRSVGKVRLKIKRRAKNLKTVTIRVIANLLKPAAYCKL